MNTAIELAVSWLPLVVLGGILLFTGRQLSRQYRENIDLSRSAIEVIRENTQALRELTATLDRRPPG